MPQDTCWKLFRFCGGEAFAAVVVAVVVVIRCGSWQGNSEENARDYRGDFGTETVTRPEARRSLVKMALYT